MHLLTNSDGLLQVVYHGIRTSLYETQITRIIKEKPNGSPNWIVLPNMWANCRLQQLRENSMAGELMFADEKIFRLTISRKFQHHT